MVGQEVSTFFAEFSNNHFFPFSTANKEERENEFCLVLSV